MFDLAWNNVSLMEIFDINGENGDFQLNKTRLLCNALKWK